MDSEWRQLGREVVTMERRRSLRLGIDVGSTTVKIVITECGSKTPLILKADESDAAGDLAGNLYSILCRNRECAEEEADALGTNDMYQGVKDIIPETLSSGEGWLMAEEIAHYARNGTKFFVILQPFGCLQNRYLQSVLLFASGAVV